MCRSVQVPRGPGHIKHAYQERLVLFKRGEAQMSVINDKMSNWIFNDFGVQHSSQNQLLAKVTRQCTAKLCQESIELSS